MIGRFTLIVLAAIGLLLGLASGGIAATIAGSANVSLCEQATYTIEVTNSSGSDITDLVVTNDISALNGFSYVANSSNVSANGGAFVCAGAAADPAGPVTGGTLTWDIDNGLSCGALVLADGASLIIEFDLVTDCTAVSGNQDVTVNYQIGGSAEPPETDSQSITVQPGAVTIKKTPAVISASLGDTVTWTLTVENTGIGDIHNVVVTDVLGAGLSYDSSAPAGAVAGQTITWSSASVADLAVMTPGQVVAVDITATVAGCDNLDNTADVQWGCSGSPCFNTATDGGTATASVQRIVDSPLLEYTPPATITPAYCTNQSDVSFVITNTGDGTASDIQIMADFDPLVVNVTSPGATYHAGANRFELTDPIEGVGGANTYTLSFSLSYPDWCTSPFAGTSVNWSNQYSDGCSNLFFPGVYVSNITAPTDTPRINLSKTGADAVQLGDTIAYNIISSYAGTCDGGGLGGPITVVDTVPAGFAVVGPVADGGIWDPNAAPTGDGATGGTVTWTYTPPATLDTSLTLQSPPVDQCDVYCFTTVTNSVTASGPDCCGCDLSSTADHIVAIECQDNNIIANKVAVPTPIERCSIVEYTNTYDFAAGSGITLSDLVFTEQANNQQVFAGALAVDLGGTNLTACATAGLTDNTPGGDVQIDFSGCGATLLDNQTLTIVYEMEVTENSAAACTDGSFYSWSGLAVAGSSSLCSSRGAVATVTTQAPAMNLNMTGFGQIVGKCESDMVNITLGQTSATAIPKDVRLVLSGLNYYVVNPASTVCGGAAAPLSCTPTQVGDDYVWEFADNFTAAGQQATIAVEVRKKCNDGSVLDATAYFDDRCNDDGTSDDTCSTSASISPVVLTSGDLLIEKTPEVYYAANNTVTWTIYVTNRGDGSAYDVWVDDTLGAGLLFTSGTVTVSPNPGDVTIDENQDHLGNPLAPLSGASIVIGELTPGERREITMQATLVDCNNLTNTVETSWGCQGVDCQAPVSDTSTVEVPAPVVINTNTLNSPVQACGTTQADLVLKNSGQAVAYNLQAKETMPAGMSYQNGSTTFSVNGGAFVAGGNPVVAGQEITWTSAQIADLAELAIGDTIAIRFQLDADCDFAGGNAVASTTYENPCGQAFTSPDSNYSVALTAPSVTVSKTRADTPVGCSENVTWNIAVTNNSGYVLPVIRVEDTLGDFYTFVSATGGGVNIGQDVYWELLNLADGATVNLSLTAVTDAAGSCDSGTDNIATAYWGCGLADGNPATHPQNDEGLCLNSTGIQSTRTETTQPDVGIMSVSLSPATINSCNDGTDLTVTITNTGPTAASNIDLVVTLPAGLQYDGSVTPQVTCGGSPAAAVTPNVAGNVITFTDVGDTGNNLCDLVEAAGGNDTVTLTFSVLADCFTTANINFGLRYYDCCGTTQYQTSISRPLAALFPSLLVTKTPASSQVDCGDAQTWTVQVQNTGSGNAQVVRIEDTFGDWVDYVPGSFSGAGAYAGVTISDLSDGNPQTYGWEFNNLAAGATATFTLQGTLNPDGLPGQNDCSQELRRNNVRGMWGCGTTGDAVDNDPTTTAYDCSFSFTGWSRSNLLMPDLQVTDTTLTCNLDGSITVDGTITNSGNGSATGVVVDVVRDPSGAAVLEADNLATTPANIAAGGTGTFSYTTAPLPTGVAYTFEVTVDPDNTVCECNETNNVDSATQTCGSPALAIDKTVAQVTRGGTSVPAPTTLEPNDRIRYQVVIQNTGATSAYNVELRDVLPSPSAQFTYVPGSSTVTWPDAASPRSTNPTGTGTAGDPLTWIWEVAGDRQVILDTGESATLVFEVDAGTGIVQGTTYTNTATTTGEDGAGVDLPDASDTVDLIGAQPALVTDKSVARVYRQGADIGAVATVEPGDVIEYAYAITNVGTGTAYQVNFTDVLPSHLEYETAAPGAAGSYVISGGGAGGALGNADGASTFTTAINATIPGGETLTATYFALVNTTATQGDTLTNTATTSAVDGGGIVVPPNSGLPGDNDADDSDTATVTVAEPGLSVDKDIVRVFRQGADIGAVAIVEPGDVIEYQYAIRNTGNGSAYQVNFTDTLPAGFEYETAAPGSAGTYSVSGGGAAGALGNADGASTFTTAINATIPGGETLTATYFAFVTSTVLQGQSLTNIAAADGEDGTGAAIPDANAAVNDTADDDPDDADADDTGQETVSIIRPGLSVDKNIVDVLRGGASIGAAGPVQPGDVIVYRYTIRNVGNGTAYEVNFTDSMATGLAYDASADGDFTVDTPAAGPTSLGIADGVTGGFTTSIDATIAGGGTLTATYRLEVTSAVDQGTAAVNTAETTGFDGAGTEIPNAGADVGDNSDDDPDDADADDTGTASIAVIEPGLSVDKDIVDILRGGASIGTAGPVEPGDVIVYRYTVRNVGLGIAYNVNFTDSMASGLVYDASADGDFTVDNPASGPTTLGIADGTTGGFTTAINATIAGGGTLTATYRCQVDSTARQGIGLVNTAAASGEDGSGTALPGANPAVGDNSDDDPDDADADDTGRETIAVAQPGLSVDKDIVDILRGGASIGTAGPVEPGDVIAYQTTIRNVGLGTAYAVNFTDTLPTGLEYETDAPGAAGTYSVSGGGASGALGNTDGASTFTTSIDATIAAGQTLTASYFVVATSAISQGTSLTNTAAAVGEDGLGTAIPAANADVGDNSDDDPDDADADDTGLETIAAAEPGLSVDKDIVDILRGGASIGTAGPVEPGDVIAYQTTIRNVGLGTAYTVNFTDTLPAGLEYETGAPGAAGSYSVSGGGATGALGNADGAATFTTTIDATLPGGETLTADYYALVTSSVSQGTDLTNTAEAIGLDGAGTEIPDANPDVGDNSDDDPDDPDADDTGSATIANNQPGLSVDKDIIDILRGGASVGAAGPVAPGDVIVYRYTIRNVGLGTAYAVNFTDTLPPGVAYDTDIGDGTYTVSSPAVAATSLGIVDGTTGSFTAAINATIAGGATLTAEYRMEVLSSVSQGTDLVNTAAASGEDGAGNPIPAANATIGDNSDDDPDDADADDTGLAQIAVVQPGLSVNKEITDVIRGGAAIGPAGPVQPGDVIVYRYTIRNVGGAIAYDVNFTDNLPVGTAYDTDIANGTYTVDNPVTAATSLGITNGVTGSFTTTINATIAGGGTLIAEYRTEINSGIIQGTDLTNTAEAGGNDGAGNPISDANAAVGDNSDDDPDDPDADDTGLATISTAEPSLVTEKSIVAVNGGTSGLTSVEVGDVIRYEFEVQNVGIGSASDLNVEDQLPAGLVYQAGSTQATWPTGSSSADPTGSTGTIVWNLSADLAGGDPQGESLTIAYDVLVTSAAAGGSLTNTASAQAVDGANNPVLTQGPDPDDDDPDDADSVSVQLLRPQLAIEKEVTSIDGDPSNRQEARNSSLVTYSVTVSNPGTGTAYNVVVTDTLPAGFEAVGPASVSVGQLAPGQSTTVTFQARVGAGVPVGSHTNTAQATGTDKLDGPLDPVEDTATVTVVATPSPLPPTETGGSVQLTIAKSASPTSVTPGGLVIFSLVVTNASAVDARDVVVEDQLPTVFSYVSGSSHLDGAALADPAGTTSLRWVLPQVPAATSTVLNFSAVARADARADRYVNTAEVVGGEQPAQATVRIVGDGQADCCLSLEKEMLGHTYRPDRYDALQDLYFQTDSAMYAASELHLLGTRLKGWLKEQQIDPGPGELVAGLYGRLARLGGWYAHFNLGNLTMGSGLGLTMAVAPDVVAEAQQRQIDPEKVIAERLEKMVQAVAVKSETPIVPLVLEFYGGAPFYQADPRKGDRSWDRSDQDQRLVPSAWAMTLLRQAQALPHLVVHKDPAQRWAAAVSAWQMEQKIELIHKRLLHKDIFSKPRTYLPHGWKTKGKGERLAFQVSDERAMLLDAASMLYALSETRTAFDKTGRSTPASLEPLMEIVWQVLESMHRDDSGGYRQMRQPDDEGTKEEKQPRRFDAYEQMIVALALESIRQHNGDLPYAAKAGSRLGQLQRFVKKQMMEKDGGCRSLELDGDDRRVDPETGALRRLVDQAAAIRILLAGSSADSEKKAFAGRPDPQSAERIWAFMEKHFWDENFGLYRDSEHWDLHATYRAFEAGAVIGALREMILRLPPPKRNAALDHLTAFFEKIFDRSELQLAHFRNLEFGENPVPLRASMSGKQPLPRPVRYEGGWDRAAGRRLAPVLIRKVRLSLATTGSASLERKIKATDESFLPLDTADGDSLPVAVLQSRKPFRTATGMLSARLLADSADRLESASPVGDNGYLRDPVFSGQLGATLAEISQAGLIRLLLHSGNGERMQQAKVMQHWTQRWETSRSQAWQRWIQETGQQAGMVPVPDLSNAIYMAYSEGIPEYRKDRAHGWERQNGRRLISVAGLGQTLVHQLGFMRRHLQMESEPAAPDRFLVRVMGLQAAAKAAFIEQLYVHMDKAGSKHLPAEIEVVADSRDVLLDVKVTSAESDLFTQLSVLRSLGALSHLTQPAGALIPDFERLRKMSQRRLSQVFAHLMDQHWDPNTGTFITGDSISAWEAGIALQSLCEVRALLENTDDAFTKQIESVIRRQAQFVLDELIDSKGRVITAWPTGTHVAEERNGLAARALVAAGLLQTEMVTAEKRFKTFALAIGRRLLRQDWNPSLGLFHGESQRFYMKKTSVDRYRYSDLDIAAVIDAIVRCLPDLSATEAAKAMDQLNVYAGRLLEGAGLPADRMMAERNERRRLDLEMVRGVDVVVARRQQLYAGEQASMRIVAENICPDYPGVSEDLADLVIVDQLPPELEYIPYSSRVDGQPQAPQASGKRLTWLSKGLDSGQRQEVRFRVQVREKLNTDRSANEAWAQGRLIGEDARGTDMDRCRVKARDLALRFGRTARIEGTVYLDANGNGRRDADENGISDVPVIIDGFDSVTTGADGRYVFEALPAGYYQLRVDHRLRAETLDLRPVGAPTALMSVSDGARESRDFALVAVAPRFGRVFIDQNGNGRFDAGERSIAAARVRLEDMPYSAFSAADGFYRIDGVPVGLKGAVTIDRDQPYLPRAIYDINEFDLEIWPDGKPPKGSGQ